jgi:hypothetical protein
LLLRLYCTVPQDWRHLVLDPEQELNAEGQGKKIDTAPPPQTSRHLDMTALNLAFSVEFLLWITKMFARVSSDITLQFPFLEQLPTRSPRYDGIESSESPDDEGKAQKSTRCRQS